MDERFVSLFSAVPRRDPRFVAIGEVGEEPAAEPALAPPSEAPTRPIPVLVPDPEPDLDMLLAEAEERGREQARAELAEKAQELDRQRQLLADLSAQMETFGVQAQQDLTGHVAEIVLLLARRVVGQSLALHPSALEQVVRAAVSRFPQGQQLEVRVAPADQERVAGWLPRAEVVADEGLTGGCLVRSPSGEVDASLEVVTESLEAAVRAWQEEGR